MREEGRSRAEAVLGAVQHLQAQEARPPSPDLTPEEHEAADKATMESILRVTEEFERRQ